MRASRERKELIEKLERSRGRLSEGIAELGGALNLPRRLKHSIRRKPVWWVGGGIAAGFVAARLFLTGKRKKNRAAAAPLRHSLFLGLLGFAGKQILQQARPALQNAAREKVKNWVAGFSKPHPPAPESRPEEASEEFNAPPSDSHVRHRPGS